MLTLKLVSDVPFLINAADFQRERVKTRILKLLKTVPSIYEKLVFALCLNILSFCQRTLLKKTNSFSS